MNKDKVKKFKDRTLPTTSPEQKLTRVNEESKTEKPEIEQFSEETKTELTIATEP